MSKLYDKDILARLDKTNVELKMKLEEISKMRVNCAKLQLEIMKLYRPECVQMLETLKDINGTDDSVRETSGS